MYLYAAPICIKRVKPPYMSFSYGNVPQVWIWICSHCTDDENDLNDEQLFALICGVQYRTNSLSISFTKNVLKSV